MKDLEIRNTVHGRAVFTLRAYREGENIGRSPVLPIPPEEWRFSRAIRAVSFYSFQWEEPHWPEYGSAIALGYGSLYNHSGDANVAFRPAADAPRIMEFRATRDIAANEELTINYRWPEAKVGAGYGPTDADGLPIKPTASAAAGPAAPAVLRRETAGLRAVRDVNGLEIRDTVHGRGVFATSAPRRGDVVERCPVVLIPPAELVYVPHVRTLAYSWFHWLQPHWQKGGGAICLGYGSLYNSSDEPNMTWEPSASEERVIVFTALRDVEPGEELTYKYPWPGWVARTGFGPVDADGLPLDVPRRSPDREDSDPTSATTRRIPATAGASTHRAPVGV